MTQAIRFFSTMELTATQPSLSSDVTVGARFPGVILVASGRLLRRILYWHRTYFWAVMTPRIRDAISSTISGLDGDRDLIRTDCDLTTVSMALSPAARIVSPDSAICQYLPAPTQTSPWLVEQTFCIRVRTNKINNSLRNAQGTCGLDTPTQLDNFRLHPATRCRTGILPKLQPRKILSRQVHKARTDCQPHQVLACGIGTPPRDLHLQLACAKAELHDQLATGYNVVGADAGVMLLHLVPHSYAQVNTALANKGGDIRCREKDEGDGEVLNKRDVEAGFPAELYVGTLEEIESSRVESSLYIDPSACR